MSIRGTLFCMPVVLGFMLAGCPARMDDVEKYTRDGNVYLDNGSYAKAEAAFSKAVEQQPGEPGLLMNRGNARMMQQKYAEALADYAAALAIDPAFAQVHANRGILYDRQGDPQAAIAEYRRALELDPELGKGPSVWKRIVSNPSTDTIRGRMHYLLSLRESNSASSGGPVKQ